MGKRKQTKDKEFISIEKALDMIGPFDEYAHYDEDSEEKEGMPSTFEGSEEDMLVSLILNAPAVQGSVAAPSEATKNKFYSQQRERFSKKEDGLHVLGVFFPLTVGEGTINDSLYGVTDYHDVMIDRCLRRKSPKFKYNTLEKRIGIYSLKGKRPFITSNQKIKVSDEELVYENENEFAYAVATRALDFYGLSDAKHSKLEDNSELFKKLVKDPEKRMYNLPDQYLAMDILVCNTYCHKELEKYTSKKLMPLLIELGAIEHFKVRKRTKENIDERAKEILLPLKKK